MPKNLPATPSQKGDPPASSITPRSSARMRSRYLFIARHRARFGVDAGALDSVVKVLARHAVVDLELSHPSLEEIFLTYYESDPEDAR